MPQVQPYAASVNPARRAKQNSLRTILPQPASPPSTDCSEFEPNPVSAPTKRGRKPGPLSRAARESQRKLNHSIIEKARRTKINDALTSLKCLVPAGYGQPPPQPGDEDEEGKKKKGKKEEKDKEFKLEILERTVIFLQDLLKRVEVLESNTSSNDSAICAKCSSPLSPSTISTSIPNTIPHPKDPEPEPEPTVKRKRSLSSRTSPFNLDTDTDIEPSIKRLRSCTSHRLPPISSWLPNPDSVPAVPLPVRQIDPPIDPQLLFSSEAPQFSPSNNATVHLFPAESNTSMTGLPSPPASTHFLPQQHSFLSSSVPTLYLGASASTLQSSYASSTSSGGGVLGNHSTSTPCSRSPPPLSASAVESASYHPPPPLLSPRRTPEDESAASLLLQISVSRSGASPTLVGADTSRTRFSVRAGNGNGSGNVQAQTPGSMLGLVQVGMTRE